MVTAVISDLHLGTRTKADLLRRPELRRRLLDALGGADQVVLLGDSIELRDAPLGDALDAAAPFFEDLGEAMGGRRVVVAAGNHDHQLAAAWLGRRRANWATRPLGLEQLSIPESGDPLARLARRMSGTELVLAYPGLWLRPDVYATHGHYLDCHNPVPTFECVALRIGRKLLRVPRGGFRTPADYEAVVAPLYRAIHRIAQSRKARRAANAGKALVRALEARNGNGVSTDSSRPWARRPGLGAMAQVVDCLQLHAAFVLFGHLHRPGPLAGDPPEWRTESGTELVNTGSWVYEPVYLGATPRHSPYWPGSCVFVGEKGAPELRQLLHGLTHDELRRSR